MYDFIALITMIVLPFLLLAISIFLIGFIGALVISIALNTAYEIDSME